MEMSLSVGGKDLNADCSALIKSMRTMQEKTGRSQAECVRRGTMFGRADAKGGNPKATLKSGLVEGHMRDIVTGDNPRVEVEIVNKLGYITEATPANVVDEAIRNAAESMEKATQRAVQEAQERAGL